MQPRRMLLCTTTGLHAVTVGVLPRAVLQTLRGYPRDGRRNGRYVAGGISPAGWKYLQRVGRESCSRLSHDSSHVPCLYPSTPAAAVISLTLPSPLHATQTANTTEPPYETYTNRNAAPGISDTRYSRDRCGPSVLLHPRWFCFLLQRLWCVGRYADALIRVWVQRDMEGHISCDGRSDSILIEGWGPQGVYPVYPCCFLCTRYFHGLRPSDIG